MPEQMDLRNLDDVSCSHSLCIRGVCTTADADADSGVPVHAVGDRS